jgi:hypothetical protein
MDDELKDLLKVALTQSIISNTQIQQPRYIEPEYEEVEYYEDDYEYYEPTRLQSFLTFACSWKMTAIVAYIAIAEVLNPGHQGLLKANQLHWFWGPRAVADMVNLKLPTPEARIAEPPKEQSEEPAPVVEEKVFPEEDTLKAPSVVMVSCDKDSNGGEFARFDISGAVFQVSNVLKCDRGVRQEGDSIAVLSNTSLMSVSRDDKIQNYTREDLKGWGLLK